MLAPPRAAHHTVIAHTGHIAAVIPGAGLMILPNVSHFAPWQAPALFNVAVLQFLEH